MNVAYHLQKLGLNTNLITRIGKDEWGGKLLSVWQHLNLSDKYIQTDDEQATGVVNATLKEDNQVEYDIVYPVAWDFIEWQEELSLLVQNADYFVFGSLAARNDVSRKTLFQLLEASNTKVLDINLRPPHFNRPVLTDLLQQASVLKLNEQEVELISAWFDNYNTIEDRVKRVQQEFSINTILVTRGSKGALLYQNESFYYHGGFKVVVADTVGSGDAFLAAYLYKTAIGSTAEEALTFANTLGAFMATQSGACPEYEIAKVEEVANNRQ